MEESSAAGSRRGRPGKRHQRFTQREIQRADRAAPNRTIIIRHDGTLELRPKSSEADSEPTVPPNPWEDGEDDAS